MSIDIQKETKSVSTYSIEWPHSGRLTRYGAPVDAAAAHLAIWLEKEGLSSLFTALLGDDYDKIIHKVDELRMWLRKEEEEGS